MRFSVICFRVIILLILIVGPGSASEPLNSLTTLSSTFDPSSIPQPIAPAPPQLSHQANSVRFAVIGDFGTGSSDEAAVADLVKSWNPDFIITVGDNNYPDGAEATIDKNIGQYYHDFIYPYTGSYGAGATTNRFFPSLGNHDWQLNNITPYLNYFALPGNERYYDVVWGPVHLFALDSDSHEPDGNSSSSTQATWLQGKLAASTSCWQLIYFHHPPFSSGAHHGSTPALQWPFQTWGADAVLTGHDHQYERIVLGGFPYFVNGLGGRNIYTFGTPVPGSQIRYNADFGAMLITATSTALTYQFIAIDGTIVDTYSQTGACLGTPSPSLPYRLYLPIILKQ